MTLGTNGLSNWKLNKEKEIILNNGKWEIDNKKKDNIYIYIETKETIIYKR